MIYARFSTGNQNLDLQQDALTGAGCTQIFSDRITGAAQVKEGLIKLVEQLKAKGVELRSLTDSIDSSTPTGLFFFPRDG